MTKMNQESVMTGLAETHNTNSIAVAQCVAAYESALANLRAKHLDKIRQASQDAAVSEAALYNAVVGSDESLWEKVKSRTVGVIKYGWRKPTGRTVIVDMEDSISRLRSLAAKADAEAAADPTKKSGFTAAAVEGMIRQTEVLDKKAIKVLSLDIAKQAGIRIVSDTDEAFVSDGMTGEGKKLAKNLRNDAFELKGL